MNPLMYALLGIAAIAAICLLACLLGDDTVTVQPEPDIVPAHAQCQVADCPCEWQTDRSGWRLCHTHYRELVTHRSAS